MAVGETSGQGRPRRVISAGGGRRRPELGEPGAAPEGEAAETAEAAEPAEAGAEADAAENGQAASPPAVTEAPVDDDLERLLAEEEEIERRTREQHHEAPHFRKESD
jgi:small subunit ribosomal protein S3